MKYYNEKLIIDYPSLITDKLPTVEDKKRYQDMFNNFMDFTKKFNITIIMNNNKYPLK
jgi:hypothetical protein